MKLAVLCLLTTVPLAIMGCDSGPESLTNPSAASNNAVLTGNGSTVLTVQVPVSESQSKEQLINLNNPDEAAMVDLSVSFSDNSMKFAGGSFPGTGGTCEKSIPAKSNCTLAVVYSADNLSKALSLGSVPEGAKINVNLLLQYLQAGAKKANIVAFNIILEKSISNKAPVANDINGSTNKDEKVKITLVGSDEDKNELKYEIVSQPKFGKLAGEGNQYEYTPNLKYYGQDQFTYKVSDGNLDSNPATVTIQVVGENEVPSAKAANFTLNEDEIFKGALEGADPESKPIQFQISTQASKGKAEILNPFTGEFKYTPNENANGRDHFSFQVSDGESVSFPAVIDLRITPVNDAPVANAFSLAINEDTGSWIWMADPERTSDVDGDPLTFYIETKPSHGTINYNYGAYVVYQPAENFFGTDSFTYKVGDGKTFSSPATIQVAIAPVNDAPAMSLKTLATDGNKAIKRALNVSDVDGDSVTASVCTNGEKGTADIYDQDITYTPKTDQIGNDIIEICLTDGKAKNRFSIPITISAVDSKFANGGQINLGSTLTAQHRITLLENGKIRLAFGADDQSRRILSIRQFLEDGAADTSFGAEGQVNFTSNSLDSNIYSAISNSSGDIYAVGHAGPLYTYSGIVLKLPSGQKQAVLGAQNGIGPIFFPSLVNETYLLGQTTTAVVGGGLGNLLTDKFKNLAYGTSTTTNYAALSNNQFAVSTLNVNSSDVVLSSLSVTRYEMSNETPRQTNVDNISSISNVRDLVPFSTAFLDTTPATLIVGFRGSADVSYCARYGYVGGGAICGGNGGCYFPTQCMATSYRRELTASKGFYLVSISGSEVKLLGDPVSTALNDVKFARKGPDGIYINSGNLMYKVSGGEITANWLMDVSTMVDFAVDSRGRILVLKNDGTLTRYLRPASTLTPITTPRAPTNVLGKAGYGEVSLTWDKPIASGGAWITDYQVRYSSDGGATWKKFERPASIATSAVVTGLAHSTAYVFSVAAINSAGTGESSNKSPSVTTQQPKWSEVSVGSEITMRDNTYQLWFSNYRGLWRNLDDAENHCKNLTYNGKSGWRLPTRREIGLASYNKIGLEGREGWITKATMSDVYFWSVKDYSSGELWYSLIHRLSDGDFTNDIYGRDYNKYVGHGAVCVRQP